jgi:hypothetical protein
MGLTAAIIFTGVLAFCSIFSLVSRSAKIMPSGMKIVPLVAIAAVWILAAFPGMPLGLKIPLNIIFYFIFTVISVPVGIGSLIFSIGDREHSRTPVVVGTDASKGRVAVVYHPGMSPFTEQTVKLLASELNKKGYSVTLMTASRKAAVEPSHKAVVVSSPVYGGVTRPPMDDFLAANGPFTAPCFAFLTGGGPSVKGLDVERIEAMVKMEGGALAGGIKISQTTAEKEREKEISLFAETIAGALGRG